MEPEALFLQNVCRPIIVNIPGRNKELIISIHKFGYDSIPPQNRKLYIDQH